MQVPSILQGESRTRLLQGMAIGAVASMVIGFGWGGWVTGGTATKMSAAAVTASMVPICAEKFKSAPPEAMAEFAAAQNYDKSDVVKKYVKQVGSVDMDYSFLSDCVTEIIKHSAPLQKAEQKN